MKNNHALDIIIKMFGKSVDFFFLSKKLKSMQKVEKLDIMDLEYGFFKVTFQTKIELDSVLRNGHWFINQNFLTMRMQEPKFQPTKTKLIIVAIWLRIHILPSDYYEPAYLEKIDNHLGTLLKIDWATVNEVRDKFARFCVQVNLKKPLFLFFLLKIDNIQGVVLQLLLLRHGRAPRDQL